MLPANLEVRRSTAATTQRSPVGEEGEVADADEAAWQEVEQETAQELFNSQGHELLLVAVGGIAPAEGDVALRDRDQPAVGDGDAMDGA